MHTRPKDSIVLTGCGWVTPFAAGTFDEVLVAAGKLPDSPSPEGGYWAVPDEHCTDSKAVSGEIKRDKGAWMTATALEHALRSARLDLGNVDANRVSLVLGNALAGQLGMIRFADEVRQQSPRFVSPIHFPQTVGNFVAGAIARAYGITGPNSTVATGAASGLDAMVEARGILGAGAADFAIAGGMETLSPELAVGLGEPGVCLSEGACLFVLERAESAAKRGAPVRATLGPGSGHLSPTSLAGAGHDVLVSAVLQRLPDAVCIEHWIGRCFGSLGAGAVAGAIAAEAGMPVPFFDSNRGETISVRALPEARLRSSREETQAIITADADGTGARNVRFDLGVVSGH